MVERHEDTKSGNTEAQRTRSLWVFGETLSVLSVPLCFITYRTSRTGLEEVGSTEPVALRERKGR